MQQILNRHPHLEVATETPTGALWKNLGGFQPPPVVVVPHNNCTIHPTACCMYCNMYVCMYGTEVFRFRRRGYRGILL
jgi:hypothetical protein